MSRTSVFVLGIAAVFVLSVALSCVFTVYQTEEALVTQFGAPQEVVTDPGLHAKLPWQKVYFFDKRLLNLDAPAEEVIAQDKKRLVVDAFARWRIVDPLRFYQTLYDQNTALTRLTPILSSNVRRVLGSQYFSAVLSGRRAELMHDIRDNVNQDAANFGIKVVDVRIRRADLPPQNSEAIYGRMQQERKREANEFRAEGEETSQRIKARAEREVTVLTAEATRESASGCINSARFALLSFCQPAISSSSIISLYQENRPFRVVMVCWRFAGSTPSNSALIFWRATVGEYGGGPTTLNCASAATMVVTNTTT